MKKYFKYEDENGKYDIIVDSDKTATVTHIADEKILFKKNYTTLENAKNALVKYCGGMPKVKT